MSTSHLVEELHKLLVTGVEIPELGLVKIEADHSLPGVNILLTRLEEQNRSNWDVPIASEQYIEEIRADYIHPTLVDSTTVANTGPSPGPVTSLVMEPISLPSWIPQSLAIDKGMGEYILTLKKKSTV